MCIETTNYLFKSSNMDKGFSFSYPLKSGSIANKPCFNSTCGALGGNMMHEGTKFCVGCNNSYIVLLFSSWLLCVSSPMIDEEGAGKGVSKRLPK